MQITNCTAKNVQYGREKQREADGADVRMDLGAAEAALSGQDRTKEGGEGMGAVTLGGEALWSSEGS